MGRCDEDVREEVKSIREAADLDRGHAPACLVPKRRTKRAVVSCVLPVSRMRAPQHRHRFKVNCRTWCEENSDRS